MKHKKLLSLFLVLLSLSLLFTSCAVPAETPDLSVIDASVTDRAQATVRDSTAPDDAADTETAAEPAEQTSAPDAAAVPAAQTETQAPTEKQTEATTEAPTTAVLDEIYARFNGEHPKNYKGRSLSVSDIIVLDGNMYYVDKFGFKKVDMVM